MDIIITIPKYVDWCEYAKELKMVEDRSQTMLFKVPHLPKKTSVGDVCYLCYRGYIIGWMYITYLGFVEGFECTVTGKPWPAGNYIGRSGYFHAIRPIPYKGFQGFRYAPKESENWRIL